MCLLRKEKGKSIVLSGGFVSLIEELRSNHLHSSNRCARIVIPLLGF